MFSQTTPNIRFQACDENSKIYALAPEYQSVVAKESIITSRLEDYGLQLGAPVQGLDIQAAVRYQRALEEDFSTLVETPIQYAIYGDKQNAYTFAFGPRRKITKRSWLNPKRIFGDTYRIDYAIEPGIRSAYALIIFKKILKISELSIHSTNQT